MHMCLEAAAVFITNNNRYRFLVAATCGSSIGAAECLPRRHTHMEIIRAAVSLDSIRWIKRPTPRAGGVQLDGAHMTEGVHL